MTKLATTGNQLHYVAIASRDGIVRCVSINMDNLTDIVTLIYIANLLFIQLFV